MSETAGPICRICHDDSGDISIADVLLTPCRCTGSLAHVHRSCLNNWRQQTTNESELRGCTICDTSYQYQQEPLSVKSLYRHAVKPFVSELMMVMLVLTGMSVVATIVTATSWGIVRGIELSTGYLFMIWLFLMIISFEVIGLSFHYLRGRFDPWWERLKSFYQRPPGYSHLGLTLQLIIAAVLVSNVIEMLVLYAYSISDALNALLSNYAYIGVGIALDRAIDLLKIVRLYRYQRSLEIVICDYESAEGDPINV